MRNILNKKILILIVITIGILSVFILSKAGNSKINYIREIINIPVTPVQNFLNSIGRGIESVFISIRDFRNVSQENEELKSKIEQLEREIIKADSYRKTNEELRKALKIKDQFVDYDSLGANIIVKDIGNWFNVFRIDLGHRDGIYAGNNNGKHVYYPVVTGRGLVGNVDSSDLLSSRVVSIIDVESTVSCIVSRTRDQVILRGDLTLKDEGLIRLDYIYYDTDISSGDIIETSGLGGIYPKGILVGKVKEVRMKNNELNMYGVVEPFVDFKRLEEVIVLKNKNEEYYPETGGR